jgi:hypothetical protein
MKRLILLTAVPVALFALVAFVPTRPQGGGGGGGGPPSKLGEVMHEIDATVKALTKAVDAKGSMEAALPDVAKLQRLVLDAKAETPPSLAAITDAKAHKKAMLDYKSQMLDLERACLDLEAAMLVDDAKKSDKALRELDKIKGAGHSEFRKEGGK